MDDVELEVLVERLRVAKEVRRETTPMIEINGPANIVMLIDGIRSSGGTSEQALTLIREYAERTMRYMIAHHSDPTLTWGDVK